MSLTHCTLSFPCQLFNLALRLSSMPSEVSSWDSSELLAPL